MAVKTKKKQPSAAGRVSLRTAQSLQLVQEANASDIKKLCDTYGLRREDLGRMTGFSLRALADWSTGKLPSEPAKRRLHEIRRLLDALAEAVKSEAISSWLKTRNPAFENMTPIQVIEVGEIDRLWRMVHHMSSDSVD
jgi:DNA-binding transcriptional regulator YiaG